MDIKPNVLLFSIIFFPTVAAGLYFIFRNWRLIKGASAWEPETSIPFRIKSVLINVIAQKKLMKKPIRGIFHIFVFFGFLVYTIHTTSQIIGGLSGTYEFYLPAFLGETFLLFYDNVLDLFTLLVIGGCLFFFIRRYLMLAPELDRPSWQSIIILSLIFALMCFTLLETPAKEILHSESGSTFLRTYIISIFAKYSPDVVERIFLVGWWGHICSVLLFFLVIPLSKHAHLIWAPLNYWFLPNTAPGKMSDMDLENAPFWGASNVHEFTWKNHLDALSCIECGRCQLRCPASLTGKELSPKNIMIDLKHSLVEKMPLVLSKVKEGVELSAISESGEGKVVDSYISRDSIWACTSCYACVDACPVGNNQLDTIFQLRRSVVLNEGSMPTQLQSALQNIETQSNPWGISQDKREEWASDLNVKTMRDLFSDKEGSESKEPDVLYWVGCAGAFDDRNKKVARSVVNILNAAGVDFAILGTEENCTGDSARRAGNEYLFQSLANKNIETFTKYNVKKIITACPHCFNTLKNEYPSFGGNYEVVHHSTFIQDLIEKGKVKLNNSADVTATYHDSCYLGRYNDNYSNPRDLLKSSGVQLKEIPESGSNGMCCGAGGAQMWMEETGSERVNILRTKQLLSTSPDKIATACPFCITMIGDAVKAESKSEEVSVQDIAEIVSDALIVEDKKGSN